MSGKDDLSKREFLKKATLSMGVGSFVIPQVNADLRSANPCDIAEQAEDTAQAYDISEETAKDLLEQGIKCDDRIRSTDKETQYASAIPGTPINTCVPAGFNRQECVSVGEIKEGIYRDCECARCVNGTTPPIVSVPFTVVEKDIWSWGGDVNAKVKLSAWVGMEVRPDQICFWAGESNSGECWNNCYQKEALSVKSPADLKDVADDFATQLEEKASGSLRFGVGALVAIALFLLWLGSCIGSFGSTCS